MNHTDGPKIINQTTQQTIDEGSKHVTINNNINITTIHNVEPRIPSNFQSNNILN